jgi:hypothetical protein
MSGGTTRQCDRALVRAAEEVDGGRVAGSGQHLVFAEGDTVILTENDSNDSKITV